MIYTAVNSLEYTYNIDYLPLCSLLKFFSIVIYIYLGNFFINFKSRTLTFLINILLFVLQPILLLFTFTNTNFFEDFYNIDTWIPIIFFILLSINILIHKVILKSNVVTILSTSSLNLGYIGGSVLVHFVDIGKVIKYVNLAGIGTIVFLFTICLFITTYKNKIDILYIFSKSPITYVFFIYFCLKFLKLDISQVIDDFYIIIISFTYLKLGLLLFGYNFVKTKINFYVHNFMLKIFFSKFIILPIIIALILIITNRYIVLENSDIFILLCLSICPVAFNLPIFINLVNKNYLISDLLTIILYTTIISLVYLFTICIIYTNF